MEFFNRLQKGRAQIKIAKLLLAKTLLLKRAFFCLKYDTAHTNLAKSKNAFKHILARFSRKQFARCTWPDHCFL